MANSDWKQQIESAAYDLTHMEINTIISSEMTAAKAPSRPRELLHKIASKYDEKLNELLIEYQLEDDIAAHYAKEENHEPVNWQIKRAGFGSFQVLTERATFTEELINNAISTIDKNEDDIQADLSLLHRIRRNSTEIQDILFQEDRFIYYQDKSHLGNRTAIDIQSLTDLPEEEIALIKKVLTDSSKGVHRISYGDLSTAISESRDSTSKNKRDSGDLDLDLRQMALLKKAFDIGTSRIALQTIIGLDGDVTTRIAKRFADNQIPLVNELHHDGIRLSVNYWENLINAISKFGEAIIGLFKN